MVSKATHCDEFCLYVWRSVTAPGILYLAKGIENAQAVYMELAEDGYIVKVLHTGTDTEYTLRDGTLLPARPTQHSPSARRRSSLRIQTPSPGRQPDCSL